MRLAQAALLLLGLSACGEGTKKFTTTMEVIQSEPFTDERGLQTYGMQLKYSECPGDARRVIRAGKEFAACGAKVKPGDKLEADITATWDSDRGVYRSEITHLGDCALKQDRKDEVNYEMVQMCSDIVATGAVVGVHCDRTRPKEQIEKCPWLKRR
ncbi:MAG: hypothetical protein U0270_26760 [Labilithrix sp.]